MRRLPTLLIARIRVISRNALLNTAVYRLQPTYWKTRSDSRKRAMTQPNRLLSTGYYWQSERAGCQDSSVAAGNFFCHQQLCASNSLAARFAACRLMSSYLNRRLLYLLSWTNLCFDFVAVTPKWQCAFDEDWALALV